MSTGIVIALVLFCWINLLLLIIIGIHTGRLTDRVENIEHRLRYGRPCSTCAAEEDE